MNQNIFQEFMRSRKYKAFKNVAYGLEDGYPCTVEFTTVKQWRVFFAVDTEDQKQLVKDLKAELGKKYYFTYVEGRLGFTVGLGKNTYQDDFAGAVREVSGSLRRRGIKPSETCALCGGRQCDSAAAVKGGYRAVHRNCVNNMSNDVKNKAEKSEMSGNYFTGIIGALLGAIVGVIPSVLSVTLTETIYAVLFALIPLCIYQGYKLLKGKMNKFVIVLTVILSVFSVYLLEFLLLTYYAASEIGLPVGEAFLVMLSALSDGEMWAAMTQDSLSSFVFIALGIWYAWGRISRTAQTEIQDAETVMSTVIPYGEGVNAEGGEYTAAASMDSAAENS